MFRKSDSPAHDTAASNVSSIDRLPQEPRVQAVIGSTIHIKGDVTGDENLTIEGTVEGTITVRQHSVLVGKNGRLLADAHAKVIRIEGQVDGNLHAEEQVIIRASGVVRGNIVAPRLTMEDGCSFRGSVDMEGRGERKSETPDKPSTSDDTPQPERITAVG